MCHTPRGKSTTFPSVVQWNDICEMTEESVSHHVAPSNLATFKETLSGLSNWWSFKLDHIERENILYNRTNRFKCARLGKLPENQAKRGKSGVWSFEESHSGFLNSRPIRKSLRKGTNYTPTPSFVPANDSDLLRKFYPSVEIAVEAKQDIQCIIEDVSSDFSDDGSGSGSGSGVPSLPPPLGCAVPEAACGYHSDESRTSQYTTVRFHDRLTCVSISVGGQISQLNAMPSQNNPQYRRPPPPTTPQYRRPPPPTTPLVRPEISRRSRSPIMDYRRDSRSARGHSRSPRRQSRSPFTRGHSQSPPNSGVRLTPTSTENIFLARNNDDAQFVMLVRGGDHFCLPSMSYLRLALGFKKKMCGVDRILTTEYQNTTRPLCEWHPERQNVYAQYARRNEIYWGDSGSGGRHGNCSFRVDVPDAKRKRFTYNLCFCEGYLGEFRSHYFPTIHICLCVRCSLSLSHSLCVCGEMFHK